MQNLANGLHSPVATGTMEPTGLKMLAKDGKMRIIDVADAETLFRLIQSIPFPLIKK